MTAVEKSEYQIMDEMDSQQIVQADSTLKQALVYDIRGKPQISYMGIKWLVLKMSQAGQALQIIDMPDVKLEKHDPEDQKSWIWYATIKVRNTKTGLETIGASEQGYGDGNGNYDTFGRTKAISKAERNAYRKQIPELEIQAMLNHADARQPVQRASQQDGTAQADVLRKLGYKGEIPGTYRERHNLILELSAQRQTLQGGSD